MSNKQSLGNEIQQYSQWREELSDTIQGLSLFLKENNVTDIRTHHQFELVLEALTDDNLSVAFVAEFSRGKSEMINTIFFGNHKRRILPSGSGRTTMCPTELAYNPDKPTSVRLLPIETRENKQSLLELKKDQESWVEFEFDPDDEKSVAKAFAGMTDSKLVSKPYAQKLRFDVKESDESEFGLPINEYEEVEIPSWRHAIINLPHPLLEQGLVVLDTPGLNALGSEPELTLNQLSSAHTIVFILSHDTGVTASDLELWQQHLGGAVEEGETEADVIHRNRRKLIALNKIDSIWDGIRSEQEINDEIDHQVAETSRILSTDKANIFPVSAQKGLVGRINDDQELIERSRIKDLESAIADRLIPEKREIVIEKIHSSLDSIVETADKILNNRLKDADLHIAELKQISSKNTDVISHIMLKVQSEKSSLEEDMQRYNALRSVYNKETRKLVKLLSPERLEKLIAVTKHNMARCATSITLQKTISTYFDKLNDYLDRAMEQANDIAALSENITRDFESDHGIDNFKVRRLRLERFKLEVQRLEQKHSHLKETKTLFFREQMSITNRFYESVCTASRKVFSRALRDATNWNNNLMVPMETYVREHHTQLRRRLESVKRIHRASDTVEQRLAELNEMHSQLDAQHKRFAGFQNNLSTLLAPKEAEAAAPEAEQTSEQSGSNVLVWQHGTNF